jgi:hypothetical protein
MSIRIHQSAPSPSSVKRLAQRLEQRTPESSKRAHDVLVAAKAYADEAQSPVPQPESSQNLRQMLYELRDCLMAERYAPRRKLSDAELLFAYFSDYSDAHPNWRHEYSALNRIIPKYFPADRTPDTASTW